MPEEDVEKMEAGYSLPRQQFDWLLFHRATELVLDNGGSVIQGATVTQVFDDNGKISGVEIGLVGRGVRSEITPLLGQSVLEDTNAQLPEK